MRFLFLDASMGAAGDMLLGALVELLDDPDAFVARLNGLGLPGVRVSRQPGTRCGTHGTHIEVSVQGRVEACHDVDLAGEDPSFGQGVGHEAYPAHHHHDHGHDHGHHSHDHQHGHLYTSLIEVQTIIDRLAVSDQVKHEAKAVYDEIAQAESIAHGVNVTQVHFHEVGTLDAITDIVGVCSAMELLAPDQVLCTPINVGSGQVRCAHGIVPVPAPATTLLLRGMPSYGSQIRAELCTPTGAALLRHFVADFGPQPMMTIQRVGYGLGSKEFEAANCLRATLGERPDDEAAHPGADEEIIELRCQVDDMTGEDIAFACEQILAAGALDVFTTAVTMKKGRTGVLLTVLVRPAQGDPISMVILRHTTTLGVRRQRLGRVSLERGQSVLDGPLGPVRAKIAQGHGVRRVKPEYDDLAHLARSSGQTIAEVRAGLAPQASQEVIPQRSTPPDSTDQIHS